MSAAPARPAEPANDEAPARASRKLKPEVAAYKRGRILEEASALFHTNGYGGTTLDQVAERLHVTKPFLYSYFRNKGDILAAICEIGIRESLAAVEDAEGQAATAVEQLRLTLTRVAEIIIERHEYIVVYQREMMYLDRVRAQQILRLRHEFDSRIAKLVERAQREGAITLNDAPAMSVWMGGLLSWLPNFYRPTSRRPKEQMIDQVVHACMRLVGLN
ncbi:TetR/AcrR family transcriptional regulator [Sphingoaurantiacus capsulatus]|uniref:TetR/AcrR family transcriptional regulator n=1 Tax=Sphingoaurantiacus capsulatus TaxID=1771310 RepID=A0ABV7XB19_9SPHN